MTFLTSPEAAAAAPEDGRSKTLGRIARRLGPVFWTGFAVLLFLVLAAIFVPSITGYGTDDQSYDAFLPPSPGHLFGTDDLGRDILTRTAFGLRFDLLLIFLTVPCALVVGTLLGMLRVFGTLLGEVGMRAIDIVIGIPSIILGISVAAAMGPGMMSLALTIIIAGTPPFARLARSSMLSLEFKDFVLAARAFGMGRGQILIRHILPLTLPVLVTQLPISLVTAIVLEASLSVIGLGLPAPAPSLGGLIDAGRANIYIQIWYVLGPTCVFAALAVALVMMAEGTKALTED